jgi:hypothetical protein
MIVRSPVDICLGTRPSQVAKSRPLENASPVPIAATIALEMIGPMPGTLISRSQPVSWRAMASISPDKPSIRSSSRRQSPARPDMELVSVYVDFYIRRGSVARCVVVQGFPPLSHTASKAINAITIPEATTPELLPRQYPPTHIKVLQNTGMQGRYSSHHMS